MHRYLKALFCALLVLSIVNPITSKRSFSSGSGRHSYPKPSGGGLSGGGHGYPSSGGLLGTGGRHGYPSSGGTGSHGYPSSGTHGSRQTHGYPSGKGLSGNTPSHTGSGTNVHHHYHYNYNPPQQIRYTPTHGGPPVSYPVYHGSPPTYVYQYKDSGSKYGTLLAGLALLNLGTLGVATYAATRGHSGSGSSGTYVTRPGEVCKFGLKKDNGDYEETKIDCNLISSFIYEEEAKQQQHGGTNSTVVTTTITNITTVNANGINQPPPPATNPQYEMLPNGTLVPVNVTNVNTTATNTTGLPGSVTSVTITTTNTTTNALDVKGKRVEVTLGMQCYVMRHSEFLKNNRVSKNLVAVVNKYSLHFWRSSRGLQLPHFLTTAPNCLKLKIMSAAYLHHLTSNLLFKDCEPAFLRQLVGFMKLYTYTEDMYVVKEAEITDSMYIIHTGRVTEICENSNKSKSYHVGEHFGQLQGLLHDLPYTHSYITAMKSQILTLHLNDWEDLLKHFPKSRNAIYKHIEPYTDDDFYGDDKRDSKGYLFRNGNDQPPSSSTMKLSSPLSSSTSIQIESGRKVKSAVFLPPPGPSQTYIRSQSIIDEPYMWPTRTRYSIPNVESRTITDQPSQNASAELETEDGKIQKVKQKTTDTKDTQSMMSTRTKLSSESMVPTTSKKARLNVDVSERIISRESITLEEQEKKEKQRGVREKSPSELKSVEDYIQEQNRRDAQNWLDSKIPSDSSMQRFKGITPSMSFKKRKPHVRYEDSTPASHPVEIHELKPIIDLSTEERNLRSLDSDMAPIPKAEEKSTKLPAESSSESDSSNELKTESKSKQ